MKRKSLVYALLITILIFVAFTAFPNYGNQSRATIRMLDSKDNNGILMDPGGSEFENTDSTKPPIKKN